MEQAKCLTEKEAADILPNSDSEEDFGSGNNHKSSDSESDYESHSDSKAEDKLPTGSVDATTV